MSKTLKPVTCWKETTMLALVCMVPLSVPLFKRMPLAVNNASELFVFMIAHASPVVSGKFVPAVIKLYIDQQRQNND